MRRSSCREPGQGRPAGLVPVGRADQVADPGRRAAPARAAPAARPRRSRRCRSRAAGEVGRRRAPSPGWAAACRSAAGPPGRAARRRTRPRRAWSDARTTSDSGGRRASSAATKVWMPPCRGGKSLVTTSVRRHGRRQPCPVRGQGDPLRPPSGASRRTTARRPAGRGRRGSSPPAAAASATKSPGRRSGRARARRPAPRSAATPGSAPAWRPACPAATRNSSSGTTRGSPGDVGAGPAQQRRPGRAASRAAPRRRPRPARPISVPVRTSSVVGVTQLVGDDRLDLVVGQLGRAACRRRRSAGWSRSRTRRR